MTISASCQKCGREYHLNERFAGRNLTCKDCGEQFAVDDFKASASANRRASASPSRTPARRKSSSGRPGGNMPARVNRKGKQKKKGKSTSRPAWLPFAIGGGIVVIVAAIVLFMMREKTGSTDPAAIADGTVSPGSTPVDAPSAVDAPQLIEDFVRLKRSIAMTMQSIETVEQAISSVTSLENSLAELKPIGEKVQAYLGNCSKEDTSRFRENYADPLRESEFRTVFAVRRLQADPGVSSILAKPLAAMKTIYYYAVRKRYNEYVNADSNWKVFIQIGMKDVFYVYLDTDNPGQFVKRIREIAGDDVVIAVDPTDAGAKVCMYPVSDAFSLVRQVDFGWVYTYGNGSIGVLVNAEYSFKAGAADPGKNYQPYITAGINPSEAISVTERARIFHDEKMKVGRAINELLNDVKDPESGKSLVAPLLRMNDKLSFFATSDPAMIKLLQSESFREESAPVITEFQRQFQRLEAFQNTYRATSRPLHNLRMSFSQAFNFAFPLTPTFHPNVDGWKGVEQRYADILKIFGKVGNVLTTVTDPQSARVALPKLEQAAQDITKLKTEITEISVAAPPKDKGWIILLMQRALSAPSRDLDKTTTEIRRLRKLPEVNEILKNVFKNFIQDQAEQATPGGPGGHTKPAVDNRTAIRRAAEEMVKAMESMIASVKSARDEESARAALPGIDQSVLNMNASMKSIERSIIAGDRDKEAIKYLHEKGFPIGKEYLKEVARIKQNAALHTLLQSRLKDIRSALPF